MPPYGQTVATCHARGPVRSVFFPSSQQMTASEWCIHVDPQTHATPRHRLERCGSPHVTVASGDLTLHKKKTIVKNTKKKNTIKTKEKTRQKRILLSLLQHGENFFCCQVLSFFLLARQPLAKPFFNVWLGRAVRSNSEKSPRIGWC